MNLKKILIEVLILVIFWLIEKLWYMITHANHHSQRHQVHHFSLWMILLLMMTWWQLENYYFAYPVAIIMIIGIILAIYEWGWRHEFIYQWYWRRFWRYNSLVIVVSFIVANVLPNIPTP